jgi:hypothetical protein
MKIIELVLDEDALMNGIDAISIVENPAIEENFVALKEHTRKVEFVEQNQEKRVLMGPALIPNKTIYRVNGEEEFYVYFNRKTIARASELYLMRGYQNNHTLEHQAKIHGLSVVESWLIDDPEMDKSKLYGFNLPKGTWMVSVKCENEEIWKEFVKTGAVKGFSIEGYFADKVQMGKVKMANEDLLDQVENMTHEEALEFLYEVAKNLNGYAG